MRELRDLRCYQTRIALSRRERRERPFCRDGPLKTTRRIRSGDAGIGNAKSRAEFRGPVMSPSRPHAPSRDIAQRFATIPDRAGLLTPTQSVPSASLTDAFTESREDHVSDLQQTPLPAGNSLAVGRLTGLRFFALNFGMTYTFVGLHVNHHSPTILSSVLTTPKRTLPRGESCKPHRPIAQCKRSVRDAWS
jgi:hypothetical protein